jgi:hypothetical protein
MSNEKAREQEGLADELEHFFSDEFYSGPEGIMDADRALIFRAAAALRSRLPTQAAYEHPEHGLTCAIGGCSLRVETGDEGTSCYIPTPPAYAMQERIEAAARDLADAVHDMSGWSGRPQFFVAILARHFADRGEEK